ncbi:lysine transporter LysE [Limoniibacter endophyticus]|uniref:Lysine transporter LysE n=2 Tax=Limoniibacter endophyticus TaxID=1565040 RepID=A0A8J3DIP3_9HYPH|nr:lysine transporter LysE [Limoniibacter endophyticus]
MEPSFAASALQMLLPVALFGVASSITPGPNNFMLLSSGVNFGFRRTLPHMWGIVAGGISLFLAVGLGLGAIIKAFPELHLVLKIAGGGYLLYLAWKIASSRTMKSGKSADAAYPLSFIQAALFQWVNPKAWVLALTAFSLYADPRFPFWSVLIITAILSTVNIPCVSTWAGFGVALRGFLADPVRLKWFNICMGILLALSIWPMLQ